MTNLELISKQFYDLRRDKLKELLNIYGLDYVVKACIHAGFGTGVDMAERLGIQEAYNWSCELAEKEGE